MTLPDANVILYALDASAPSHAAASAWLEDNLSGPDTVGLTWIVLLAVLRIGTNPRVFRRPLSAEGVLNTFDEWLALPNVVVLQPTDRHTQVLRRMLAHAGSVASGATDAHLAALAVEHGATLVSFDYDFARFPGLNWVRPGAGAA